MIGVGLSFYGDLESLKRGVPTYTDKVDYIFAIDGRYSLFDGPDYSSQETIDYLKQFPNVILKQFVGMEHDKRQQYVNLAAEYKCDYLLIIDSDEYILPDADWDLFLENCDKVTKAHPSENFFGVNFRYTPEGYKREEFSPFPRLWARPEECSYYKTHCIFKGKSGSPLRSSSGGPRIEGIKMAMGDNLRSQEYLKSVSEYQRKMLDYEIPIRNSLSH